MEINSIRINYWAITIGTSSSQSLSLAGWRFNCFTESETILKKRFRIKLYPICESGRLWISKFYSLLCLLFWSWPLFLFWGASDPSLNDICWSDQIVTWQRLFFFPSLVGWIRSIKVLMSARFTSKKGSGVCKCKNDVGRKENKQRQMVNC